MRARRPAVRFDSAVRLTFCLMISIQATGLAQTTTYPTKPDWSVTPSRIRPVQGKYPSTVTAILYLNACQPSATSVAPKNVLDVDSNHTYKIVATGSGISASNPVVGECTLTTTLTIDSSTQFGDQLLNVTEATSATASGVDKGVAVLSLADPTSGPTPGTPEVDVMWDVMSQHVCSDDFGNHLPRFLYCVEVKIGNNSAHSLQLAGIGFKRANPLSSVAGTGVQKTSELISPNTSYQTSRAVAQAGGGTTARNIVYNSVQAVGLIMASFTPFFHNTNNSFRWATGSAIVSGSVLQGINLVAPDLTLRELNNLDDQSFRDGKLIPNNTQVRMIVFVDKSAVAEGVESACKSLFGADTRALNKCKSSPSITTLKLALGDLVIVGTAVDFLQRVVVDTSVTSQEVNPGPVVTEVSPTPAGATQEIKITGTGFGATQGTSIVKFGSVVAAASDITKWSNTEIVVKVPASTPGPANVVVTVGGKDSAPAVFTVAAPAVPAISNIAPASAAAGVPVTITGTGFGTSQGASSVKFGAVPAAAADITNWSDKTITVKVPPGVGTGAANVVVTVGGQNSAPVAFTVTASAVPAISNIAPASAAIGATVTITGTGFGATQGASSVKFGAIPAAAADITNWSDNTITVRVPTGARTGAANVVVTVGGQNSAPVSFTVHK